MSSTPFFDKVREIFDEQFFIAKRENTTLDEKYAQPLFPKNLLNFNDHKELSDALTDYEKKQIDCENLNRIRYTFNLEKILDPARKRWRDYFNSLSNEDKAKYCQFEYLY